LLGTAAGNCLLCARAQHSKLAFNWKISNSSGSNSKNGLFVKFGMWKKKMASVVGVASWGGNNLRVESFKVSIYKINFLRSLILFFKVDNFSMGFTTFGAFVNNRVTQYLSSQESTIVLFQFEVVDI
jgi:hypothetical protein